MLRVRHTNGKVEPLPQSARFIELTDQDGRLAVLIHMDDQGIVHVSEPHEKLAMDYARLFRMPLCKTIDLDQCPTIRSS